MLNSNYVPSPYFCSLSLPFNSITFGEPLKV
jgi:hypothetical protein